MDKKKIAQDIYCKVKKEQLKDFQQRMPEDKQGVEFEVGGIKYVAAIRRLTPKECAELQTMPQDYEFVTNKEDTPYMMHPLCLVHKYLYALAALRMARFYAA